MPSTTPILRGRIVALGAALPVVACIAGGLVGCRDAPKGRAGGHWAEAPGSEEDRPTSTSVDEQSADEAVDEEPDAERVAPEYPAPHLARPSRAGPARPQRRSRQGQSASGKVRDLVERAALLAKHGRLPEAIAAMHKAHMLQPDDADIATALGRLNRLAGRLDAAERAYLTAMELDPDNDTAMYEQALVLMARNENAGARRYLEVLARRRPKDLNVRNALAKASSNAKDPEGVVEALAAAAEIEPENADTRHRLGQALGRSGRFSDATQALRQAASARPEDGKIQLQLGTALGKAGKLKEAEAALLRSATLAPKDARAWKNLAAVREQRGDAEGAAKAYEALIVQSEGADPDGALRERIAKLRKFGLAPEDADKPTSPGTKP